MRDRGLRYGVAAVLLATSACVHMRVQVGGESESQVAPTLIGCSGYIAPASDWTASDRVSIRLRVQADGTVEPSSLQHHPSRFDRGGDAAVARALSLAQACSFEPATEDEEPVAAWTNVRFAFSEGE